MSIRVSIVEDDDRVRGSLASLIDGARGFRCSGAHPTAEAALKHIPSEAPDVVLMDIHLPHVSGIECVRKLKTNECKALVVMLTAYEDDDLIFQALKVGANGYLLKQTTPTEILAAIKEVHDGGAPMSSNIARKVIQSFHGSSSKGSLKETLTPREHEILRFLARGYTNKEIAGHLEISPDTVGSHVKKIYEKIHVNSRAQAVAKYLRRDDASM